MKALVTGATGFTGSRLVEKLLEVGHTVRVLVRDRKRLKSSLIHKVEVFEGDIRDKAYVMEAVRGMDVIFNLAAYYRSSDTQKKIYYDIHVEGTRHLLDAALKHKAARIVHCSTVGVYGDVGNTEADERQPFAPGDIYQTTKLYGEMLVTEYHKNKGLPTTIIRPTAIYGPGDERLLKLFKIASRRPTFLLGDGKIYYHMIYVDDLVNAFILAAESEQAVGKAFIVGGDECLQLNELIDIIGPKLGNQPKRVHLPAYPFQLLGSACEKVFGFFKLKPPLYRRRVDFFTKSRRFNTQKVKNVLGYSTQVSLDEGLGITAKWYQENKLI